jgi:putative transmembrane protein PGPGW
MDYQSGKRKVWHIVRLGLGWLLTAIGIVLLVLPGPGVLFLIPGLTLLSAESLWVRRFLRRLRQRRLVSRAIREAEKAGIKIDFGPDDDGPEDSPSSSSGPTRPSP